MKYNQIAIWSLLALMGIAWVSCGDECDYLDTNTDNPSWVSGYEDGDEVKHPESLASTQWVRGKGLKYNAFGEEIQGFVESLDFYTADSVIVKMSQGCTEGVWVDESNTEKLPSYEYTYSDQTGTIQILKAVRDENNKVSKYVLFTGVVTIGKKEVLTICHFGDTPVQTYLVKK